MGKKKRFSSEELRSQVWYDEQTGLFHSLRKTARSKIGDVVSSFRKDGYCCLNVFGQRFLAHRMVWLYMYDEWLDKNVDIDHIDGNPSNNLVTNLRVVTRSENLQNQRKLRKNNVVGINGISWHSAREVFVVQLSIGGEHKFGGHHKTIGAAICALSALKAKWHPFAPA